MQYERTITDMIGDQMDRGARIDDGSEAVLDEVLATPSEARRLLEPLVQERYRKIQRTHDRKLEQENDHAVRAESSAPARLEARKAIATNGFMALGEWVTWSNATVEHHRDAAALQRRIARGHEQTAERHEQTANDLESAGFTCLADMNAAAAA